MLTRFLSSSNIKLTNRLKRMFEADNNHIHHIILNAGYSTNQTVSIICGIVLIGSCFAFISLLYYSITILIVNLILAFIVTSFSRTVFSIKK